MMRTIWMMCGPKPLYLPLAVADSVAELSSLTGYTPNAIWSYASKVKRGLIRSEKFISVEVEEDEDD